MEKFYGKKSLVKMEKRTRLVLSNVRSGIKRPGMAGSNFEIRTSKEKLSPKTIQYLEDLGGIYDERDKIWLFRNADLMKVSENIGVINQGLVPPVAAEHEEIRKKRPKPSTVRRETPPVKTKPPAKTVPPTVTRQPKAGPNVVYFEVTYLLPKPYLGEFVEVEGKEYEVIETRPNYTFVINQNGKEVDVDIVNGQYQIIYQDSIVPVTVLGKKAPPEEHEWELIG